MEKRSIIIYCYLPSATSSRKDSTTNKTSVPIEPVTGNIQKLGVEFLDMLGDSLLNNSNPPNQTSLIEKFERLGIAYNLVPRCLAPQISCIF
jgi:hypothetical protein